MKKLILIMWLSLGAKSWSQNPLYFYTRYGSDKDDISNGIIQSVTGEYVLIGQTAGYGASHTDILLTKNNDLGVPLWQKTFGGFNADIGQALVELGDSSLVFVGYTNSFGNGGYDAIIYRANKHGDLIWQKTFGGLDWDFGYSINKTADGNLIICGETYSYGRGGKDGFILKMDYDGNFLWQKIYGGSKDDGLKKIIQTTDGGYIAVGTTKSYGDTINGDIWITKINSSGDSTWFATRGGIKKEIGNSIVQDNNGDYLVTGGSESFSSGKEDAYIFKLSNNNTFIWDRFYGLPTADEESYEVLNSGSAYGSMLILFTTTEVSGSASDIKNILLNEYGYYVRGGSFGGTSDDIGYAMCNTKDKGYVASGYTEGYDALQKDFFIVKYDSEMTIGPLIVGLKKNYQNVNMKIYPTISEDATFYLDNGDSNKEPLIKIYDIYGRLIEPVKIEKDNNNLFVITIPDGLKGLIFINVNNGSIVKKCIVN